MQKIYSTTMINKGGRSGKSYSPNHSFKLNIEDPGSKNLGTNPEELFAAGYSACFNSALDYVKKKNEINVESVIKVRASLYNHSDSLVPDVTLGVDIEGWIKDTSIIETQRMLEEAHQACPYSRAIRGNIPVTITAVEQI